MKRNIETEIPTDFQFDDSKDNSTNKQVHFCQKCDAVFTNRNSVSQHLKTKHEGVEYLCGQCDYKATQKGHLKIHTESIHELIRYSCTQCAYQATKRGNLRRHVKAVHGENSIAV